MGNHRWDHGATTSTCKLCHLELRVRKVGKVHTHEWRPPGGAWRSGARPFCAVAPSQASLPGVS